MLLLLRWVPLLLRCKRGDGGKAWQQRAACAPCCSPALRDCFLAVAVAVHNLAPAVAAEGREHAQNAERTAGDRLKAAVHFADLASSVCGPHAEIFSKPFVYTSQDRQSRCEHQMRQARPLTPSAPLLLAGRGS